jgi:hypothetical protein
MFSPAAALMNTASVVCAPDSAPALACLSTSPSLSRAASAMPPLASRVLELCGADVDEEPLQPATPSELLPRELSDVPHVEYTVDHEQLEPGARCVVHDGRMRWLLTVIALPAKSCCSSSSIGADTT